MTGQSFFLGPFTEFLEKLKLLSGLRRVFLFRFMSFSEQLGFLWAFKKKPEIWVISEREEFNKHVHL